MTVIILVVELNAFYGVAATQRPLGSVSGTITSGFVVTLVLAVAALALL